jgi:hypothetical protein
MAINFLKNDLPFYVAKFRQFRERKVDPSLTDCPEHLKTLQRDGIVVIHDFLDRRQVQEIVDEIHTRTDLMTERKSSYVVERNARYLLLNPEDQLPSTSVFFQSRLVNGLARAYLSKHVVLDRPAVQLKVNIAQKSIVDFFHIDEWRHLISAFLFLTDVGDHEAPMVYLKGSHRQRLWRLQKEKEFFSYYEKSSDGEYLNDESAYCGCWLPTEARRLRERHNFESITCTGEAGTLVVFDNLGLHRSTVLRKNYRLILSGYWMLPK